MGTVTSESYVFFLILSDIISIGILIKEVIHLDNILKNIPGFRSGKKYKRVIAIVYYIFAALMFTEGFGYGLYFLASPFLTFAFIDLIRHKKRSIPLKKALVSFAVPLMLTIVSLLAMPYTETEGALQGEQQETEVSQELVDGNGEEQTQTIVATEKQTEKEIENINKKETEKAPEKATASATEEPANKEAEELVESTANSNSTLEVHFIDVGQADASLILSDGESMLIDGGNPQDSSLIYTYLKNKGIDHLDYIVNTHPHADHVGGLAGALNYASVDTVLASMAAYDSKAFNSFLKYLNEQNVSITVPNAGDTFNLGSAKVQILGPVYSSNDVNNNSIVLKITFGNTAFLFTGDAEREEEQDILAKGYDLNSTVLKVGHHGSDTSTTYPFLREIMPEYAVISVGSNSYGHPTEDTLSRLRDADAKVLRTDMQGDIIFTSDGQSVSYTVQRNADADTLVSAFKPTPVTETKPAATASNTETQEESNTEVKYILNTNSGKIHYPNCSSVKKMSEKNKKETSLSINELNSQGYDPCGICRP